jgi:hypothetical protein
VVGIDVVEELPPLVPVLDDPPADEPASFFVVAGTGSSAEHPATTVPTVARSPQIKEQCMVRWWKSMTFTSLVGPGLPVSGGTPVLRSHDFWKDQSPR